MKRFEYKKEKGNYEMSWFQMQGNKGWELVAITKEPKIVEVENKIGFEMGFVDEKNRIARYIEEYTYTYWKREKEENK